jgi:hypothetical protein
MDDYLTFRKMITPVIIQVLFWLGVVGVVVASLFQIVRGILPNYGGGAMVLRGLVILIVGPLLVRVYCELLILLFRMNETLTEIRDALKKKK